MTKTQRTILNTLVKGSVLAGLIAFASGCVVAAGPREGYWDHDHHRWYHEGSWHDCGEPGAICR
jgi:hypothetical protein